MLEYLKLYFIDDTVIEVRKGGLLEVEIEEEYVKQTIKTINVNTMDRLVKIVYFDKWGREGTALYPFEQIKVLSYFEGEHIL